MKITILCSSETHPINPYLFRWIENQGRDHEVELVRRKDDAKGGDLLLLISCVEILTESDRLAYTKTLVIHASDLPKGRGWSPHIWQILEGKTDITVTLLEAENTVDSGDIWHQINCHIPRHALWNEINDSVFNVELKLMDFAVDNFGITIPTRQNTDITPTYYTKRTPADSELDIHKSLLEQFDMIRVSDPERFPAYFKLNGHVYKLRLEKISND
jgi:methionyl-tRNA formyltransferase